MLMGVEMLNILSRIRRFSQCCRNRAGPARSRIILMESGSSSDSDV
jgi:hypothetical protein